MSKLSEVLSNDFDAFKKHVLKLVDDKVSKNTIKKCNGDLKTSIDLTKLDVEKLKKFTEKMNDSYNIKLFMYVINECNIFLKYDKDSGNFIYIYDSEYRADKEKISNYIVNIIDRCYRYTMSQSIDYFTSNFDKYTTMQNYIDRSISTARYKKACIDLLKKEM